MPFLFDKPPPLYIPERPAIIRPVKRIATAQLVGRYRIRRLDSGEWVQEMFHSGFWMKVGGATRLFTDSGGVTSGASYNFGTKTLGTAIGTSLVVVCVHGGSNGNGFTSFTAVSIDGTNGTIHAQLRGGSNASLADGVSAIASRATSNTTGNITATPNVTSLGCCIEVYRLNLLTSATPDATITAGTGTVVGTSFSGSLVVSVANSIVIWGVGGRGADIVVTSGGTLGVDQTQHTGNASVGASASNQNMGAQTLTLGATSTSIAGSGAGACWH